MLFETILALAKCKGGTIHQYLDISDPQYDAFRRAFEDYVKIGFEFPSRAALDKLAAQYAIRINWQGTGPIRFIRSREEWHEMGLTWV